MTEVSSLPPIEGLGMSAHKQMARRIIAAYPSFWVRAYARVRFQIINVNLLTLLALCLHGRRRVLDIGCGFGILGCYLSLRDPELQFTGFDLNARRIQAGQQAAAALGLPRLQFHVKDARQLRVEEQFDAIVLVDFLHHLPDAAKVEILQFCQRQLAPGGILVLKEVARTPWPKLAFTWVLDVLVTGGFDMWYWSEAQFSRELGRAGFQCEIYPIKALLPYPHILYRCSRTGEEPQA